MNNKNEIKCLDKCTKKYKKIIIISVIICIVFFMSIGLFILKSFTQQYNHKGISNYINISINDSIGKTYLCENNNLAVYTYHLSEAYVIDFHANKIFLKDALENGKLDIDDLTKYLHYEGENDEIKIYTWENYQIMISGKECIISSLAINANEVIYE